MWTAERRLRIAFAAGAVTDALALVPMLSPTMAELVWGTPQDPFGSALARGYAASLMSGWTLLLLWAFQRPIERRLIAPLTALVIVGLASAQALAVIDGVISFARMLPTWILQAALIWLFVGAYVSARAPTNSN
jgi:hypothetical protein